MDKQRKTTAAHADARRKSIAKNRRARYDYEVLEELECGIALVGTEVKSLREGQCSIAEAYSRVKGDELFLIGMNISEYSHGNVYNHMPDRERRLLAHTQEIRKWAKLVKLKGTTIDLLMERFDTLTNCQIKKMAEYCSSAEKKVTAEGPGLDAQPFEPGGKGGFGDDELTSEFACFKFRCDKVDKSTIDALHHDTRLRQRRDRGAGHTRTQEEESITCYIIHVSTVCTTQSTKGSASTQASKSYYASQTSRQIL